MGYVLGVVEKFPQDWCTPSVGAHFLHLHRPCTIALDATLTSQSHYLLPILLSTTSHMSQPLARRITGLSKATFKHEMSAEDCVAVKTMLVNVDTDIKSIPYTAPPGEKGADFSHEGGEYEVFEGLAQQMADLSGLCLLMQLASVRAAQNEKAHTWMARKCTGLAAMEQRHGADNQHESECLVGSNKSCGNPQQVERTTVEDVHIAICDWQFNWGPENTWEKQFNNCLCAQQEHNSTFRLVDTFLSICDDHVQSGQEILRDLRKITASYCRNGRVMKDKFIQIYDMLTIILSELKFFEVKLDEYAPSIPTSRLSSICYYEQA
ncbi:hypothetical protein BDR05DRAFT_948930 [Suillus weaverae]|nr:hypothetical protein BDR05DRAFT_948930 [Suillus weaverae]